MEIAVVLRKALGEQFGGECEVISWRVRVRPKEVFRMVTSAS